MADTTTDSNIAKQQEIKKKKRKPILSKKERKLITDPLDENSPITVQVLGICSALAVTTQIEPAFWMTVAVIFVLVLSNLIISLIRNTIPSSIRIIVQLTVIATLVILVDQMLKAFLWDMSKQLSVFVGLIITNCIIMGRLEAFAMGNKPWPSVLDGFGNALGYGAILIIVSFFRELFGAGKLLGYEVIPQFVYDAGYVNNGVMVIPAGALFVVGLVIWVQRSLNKQYETH